MREKLINIIASADFEPVKGVLTTIGSQFTTYFISPIADRLIANGVTIPVRCKKYQFLGWRGTNTNDCGYFYCKHPSGLRAIKDAHTSFCDYGERRADETNSV